MFEVSVHYGPASKQRTKYANQSEANTQPNEASGRQRTKMTTRQGSGPRGSRDLPGKDLGLNSSRRDLVTAALVLGWVTCNYMQYNQ